MIREKAAEIYSKIFDKKFEDYVKQATTVHETITKEEMERLLQKLKEVEEPRK